VIVLVREVEAWIIVSLLYTLNKVSTVRLFEPTSHHTNHSSFNMIAAVIQSPTASPQQVEQQRHWNVTGEKKKNETALKAFSTLDGFRDLPTPAAHTLRAND
jgi:hypothetical protein